MSIIRCPECNAKISNKAVACVKCGAPVSGKKGKKKNRGCDLLFLVGLIGAIMLAVHYRETIRARLFPEPQPVESETQQEWSTGGNLHHATMKEWTEASYENRLATSADLVGGFIETSGNTAPSDADLNTITVELEKTMSAANQNRKVDDHSVQTVADTCWILIQNK